MRKRIFSAVLCCAMMAASFAGVPALGGNSNADNSITVSAASKNYGGLYYVSKRTVVGYYCNGLKSKEYPKGTYVSISTDGYLWVNGIKTNVTGYISSGNFQFVRR